ncbi:alpha/beta fold hydrolase [Fodinicola acaciae]|uniref:alpha/beta fold hydrolase n=1 Tax=Fodinicola acaciae TaxID=2681555 RepID=UPI0013D358D8|nr:alpha/beta hydrolase [Fodinicola acaciae]
MTSTRTLDVPDGSLYYEVRGRGPLVALVGAPMDATSFQPLANLLAADHTVLTTDPRGIKRSRLADPRQDSTPLLRADDLRRLLTHLDRGPATVFGSSGGAATALALAQSHPETVTAVIAHEPPMAGLVEHGDRLLAQTDDVIATYLRGDVTGAWTNFLANANIALPDGALEMMIGGERDPQTVADERRWFAHELRQTVAWTPDIDALRSGRTPIVIGIGQESTGQSCDRISRSLAAKLDLEPVMFPGDHTGFVEETESFAAQLRKVLTL